MVYNVASWGTIYDAMAFIDTMKYVGSNHVPTSFIGAIHGYVNKSLHFIN